MRGRCVLFKVYISMTFWSYMDPYGEPPAWFCPCHLLALGAWPISFCANGSSRNAPPMGCILARRCYTRLLSLRAQYYPNKFQDQLNLTHLLRIPRLLKPPKIFRTVMNFIATALSDWCSSLRARARLPFGTELPRFATKYVGTGLSFTSVYVSVVLA